MTVWNRWRETGRPSARASTRRSTAAATAVAVTGLLLLATAAFIAWPGQPVSEFGGGVVQQLSEEPTGTPTAAESAPPRRTPDSAVVPVQPGAPPTATPPLPPVAIRIEAIELAAPVVEIGVVPDSGVLEVPPAELAGWYRYGPGLSATAGSVVIAGHVDSAHGPGVFARLPELAPGDEITVAGEDGSSHQFEVVGREVYHKDELPLSRYFARDGQVRLTLITCGGPFDESAGDYRDNVVVTAAPR